VCGLNCIEFTVHCCVYIPLRENVSGLFAPAGFCSPKTANSTMGVNVERCSFRPQRRKQVQFISAHPSGYPGCWLTPKHYLSVRNAYSLTLTRLNPPLIPSGEQKASPSLPYLASPHSFPMLRTNEQTAVPHSEAHTLRWRIPW
jgi:hypothetical protein